MKIMMKDSLYEELEYMVEGMTCRILRDVMYAGIILLLISVSLLIYGLCKKQTLKVALALSRSLGRAGISIIILSILVNYISHFGNNFVYFKWIVPAGFFLIMLIGLVKSFR